MSWSQRGRSMMSGMDPKAQAIPAGILGLFIGMVAMYFFYDTVVGWYDSIMITLGLKDDPAADDETATRNRVRALRSNVYRRR